MQQYTELELFNEIKKGNVLAFESAFNRYADDLVRYGVTLLKSKAEAEDLVQQLFVQLWAKRESMVITTSFKSYLYRWVHNSSLNRLKQEQVKRSYASDFSVTHTETARAASYEAERKETGIIIETAINELPEQCRRIFRMSKMENMKYQQIADELQLSVKTVENQMGKALKYLRERLKQYVSILLFLILHQ